MNNFDQKIIEEFEKLSPVFNDEIDTWIPRSKARILLLYALKTQREMFMKCVPEKVEINEEHITSEDCDYCSIGSWNCCTNQEKRLLNSFREEMLNNILKI